MKCIARKEISRKITGTVEIVTNDIIEFEFENEFLFQLENIFDDWEYGQEHGVYQDEDGYVVNIDVNMCIEELEEKIVVASDEEYMTLLKDIVTFLSVYRGYVIWF